MNITTFTLEQSAGQRLMVGFDGTELNTELKFLIKTLKVGGIILFSRNLIDPSISLVNPEFEAEDLLEEVICLLYIPEVEKGNLGMEHRGSPLSLGGLRFSDSSGL